MSVLRGGLSSGEQRRSRYRCREESSLGLAKAEHGPFGGEVTPMLHYWVKWSALITGSGEFAGRSGAPDAEVGSASGIGSRTPIATAGDVIFDTCNIAHPPNAPGTRPQLNLILLTTSSSLVTDSSMTSNCVSRPT